VLPAVARNAKELGLSQTRVDFWKMRVVGLTCARLVFGAWAIVIPHKLMAAAAAIWSLATGLTP